ncbi:hypothetical protein SRHO_G00199810 [Serrasalmus rhombeus]
MTSAASYRRAIHEKIRPRFPANQRPHIFFLPASIYIELHPYYRCIAPRRLSLTASLTVLRLLRIFFKTKELDLSFVEGDISSATSTLFLCLAPADPHPAGSLTPHNVLTHRRKY